MAVNLNYTVNSDILNYCIAQCGIRHVLTSKKFMERFDFKLDAEMVYLEDLREQITLADKLVAAFDAYVLPLGLLERHLTIDRIKGDDLFTIIFTSGLRTYRNHLRTECPGVEKLNSTFGGLATEPWGSQLCEGDFVRVFDTTGVRSVGLQAYPRCVLGWFEPMPNEPRQSKPSKP